MGSLPCLLPHVPVCVQTADHHQVLYTVLTCVVARQEVIICCVDRSDSQFHVGQFPTLKEKHDDIGFLNKLWHTTNEEEERILGDYVAATGGATVHTHLLQQLVASGAPLTSG